MGRVFHHCFLTNDCWLSTKSHVFEPSRLCSDGLPDSKLSWTSSAWLPCPACLAETPALCPTCILWLSCWATTCPSTPRPVSCFLVTQSQNLADPPIPRPAYSLLQSVCLTLGQVPAVSVATEAISPHRTHLQKLPNVLRDCTHSWADCLLLNFQFS